MFNIFKRRAALAAIVLTTGSALALTACGGGSGGSGGGETGGAAPTFNASEKVTLNLAFWGNDVRADLYNKAIAAFNKEYPNITVNPTFLGFPEFWEKRQTEAAGGNLPDVMQFDYSYLRQYSENGLLLPLNPYLGNIIDTKPLSKNILEIGVVDDKTTGIPTSTNAWGLFTNPVLIKKAGANEWKGGDWKTYTDWLATISKGSDGKYWGGQDYTGRIQNFEVQLRAEGKNLFSEDGKPGFDKKRLAEFWESGAPLRTAPVGMPQKRVEEILPKVPFESALTAAELTWDNFGAGYLKGLGSGYTELGLVAPPVTKAGAKDLYLKPSMLHAISSNTKHPEAAATLVNFLVNSPKSGEIFGTNRGLPASTTALAAAQLDKLSQQIKDYETSIADRLGDAPPVPIVGAGTLEEKFRQIGMDLNFGKLTVDQAVEQFFSEMDVVLNK